LQPGWLRRKRWLADGACRSRQELAPAITFPIAAPGALRLWGTKDKKRGWTEMIAEEDKQVKSKYLIYLSDIHFED